MNTLMIKTPKEINMEIAKRIREIRRRRKISQDLLASKSGVSLGSIKRFESTGQISLTYFTKITLALGIEKELEELFNQPHFSSIEEILNGQGK